MLHPAFFWRLTMITVIALFLGLTIFGTALIYVFAEIMDNFDEDGN